MPVFVAAPLRPPLLRAEGGRARVVVAWSTGKDSAWCLHTLREAGEVDVVGLLTTVTATFDRVSVHGTRRSIVRAQARALGLPLREVEIPYPCPNEAYEEAMRRAVEGMRERERATHVAFGDLFLEDVRAYREDRMSGSGMEPLFPLWGMNTQALAGQMVDGGLEAVIVAAPEDSPVAPQVGRRWHPDAIAALGDVDPCGERGEFHTCVVGGAGITPLEVRIGETIVRDGCVFADLELVGS